MNSVKSVICLAFLSLISLFSGSCSKPFKANNFTAYFGGEVTNPNNRYVVLMKGDEVIDSLFLDRNNRFFAEYDSLAPGLYTFKHEPEYQYVYFDKNDSLLVSINARDFDESIVFTGRGERKNNFLMEMFLRNERDRDSMFTVFDYDVNRFIPFVERSYRRNLKYYERKKKEINWSEEFELFANASVELPYYSKLEVYPLIHKMRTGQDLSSKLPANYYAFRKKVDFNNEKLAYYSPFVKYISHMLNNIAALKHRDDSSDLEQLALNSNTSKLHIADTLLKNPDIKNTILNNIAFTYLMEDQDIANNKQFFSTYHKYSTDDSQTGEINKMANAIQRLKSGNALPQVMLVDTTGDKLSSASLKKPTVIFFWSENALQHLVESHKRALDFKAKYPSYHYVAVNLDDNQSKWLQSLEKYKLDGIQELRSEDFEDIRVKWAITKIYRTIVVNPDGTIKNAFTNLFDKNFEDCLRD